MDLQILNPADGICTSPPQAFHLKVGPVWIAPASDFTLRTLDAFQRFECRNLFLQLHN